MRGMTCVDSVSSILEFRIDKLKKLFEHQVIQDVIFTFKLLLY